MGIISVEGQNKRLDRMENRIDCVSNWRSSVEENDESLAVSWECLKTILKTPLTIEAIKFNKKKSNNI